MAVAHDWFARQLLEQAEAKAAREYLEGRDIPLETAAMLGLGFAPVGKTLLQGHGRSGSRRRGFCFRRAWSRSAMTAR